ncbi:hemolysin secretion protein D [Geothrix rubra]|uniref:Hemolysin secretion protein D n=1 Tax=Geothrix rubra TaxID=2927977 RepID=A0ABQ5Q778_9BACT|nr:efflux RND transporter periplasmic adaptor subunit [Geothrix rubra]GLH70473.1 hemolysin secretion protein D [Geothrix rubra]
MNRRTRWILAVAGVMTAALTAWAAFGRSPGADAAYTVETVRRQDLKDSVTVNGEIQARTRVNVGTSVNGEIKQIHVADGQWVKAGDLLVTLDQERLRQDQVRAELSLDAARQDLGNAKATRDKQARTLQRRSELFAQGIVSSEDFQQEKLNLQNAETQLQRARVAVQQAEAAVAQARDMLSKTVLRAPMSGQVTGLRAEKGETAIAGQTNVAGAVLMVISDVSEMMAELKVGELDVVKVRVGQPAEVSVDALPGRIFTGKVVTVASGTDRPANTSFGGGLQEVQSYKVRIQLDGSPVELQALRPGMSARIAILTAERKAVLAVPLAAIQERESKSAGLGLMTLSRSVVFVARNGKAEERVLGTGLSTRRAVEVLQGLQEGDQVITGPTKLLSALANGKAITVKPEAGSGARP